MSFSVACLYVITSLALNVFLHMIGVVGFSLVMLARHQTHTAALVLMPASLRLVRRDRSEPALHASRHHECPAGGLITACELNHRFGVNGKLFTLGTRLTWYTASQRRSLSDDNSDREMENNDIGHSGVKPVLG